MTNREVKKKQPFADDPEGTSGRTERVNWLVTLSASTQPQSKVNSTSSIAVWFSSRDKVSRKKLQCVVNIASKTTGSPSGYHPSLTHKTD